MTLAARAGARVVANPRGGKVAAQNNAVRQTKGDVVAFTDANSTWAAGCPAQARSRLRRSRRGVRVRPAERAGGRRPEQGGPVLAVRARRPRRGVPRRLGHRRKRVHLRGAALGLRRGRSALRPRPVVSVSDGAARTARRLRARSERVREGDADDRGRVPPQGAGCSSTAGRSWWRARCSGGCARCTGSRSFRIGICATRAASCISSCWERTLRCSVTAPCTR